MSNLKIECYELKPVLIRYILSNFRLVLIKCHEGIC